MKLVTNALVTNKSNKAILSITCNLLPTQCRVDNLEGREYTVVPMVILTEGVHAGSMGPLYYPKAELEKTPEVWNMKPVVVYHPTMNGQGISACDPVVINSRKVGVIMNTRFEKGKLKSEAWIEKDRANAVDERIMAAVENNEMMELSTGVFVDTEMEGGEFKGEAYTGIARNYRPDHLALLPDQIGACSIADGAGFLRNQAHAHNVPMESIMKALAKLGLSTNALSHSDIHSALSTALREKFGRGTGINPEPGIWVADVFSNFVIYENGNALYRLGYTSNDNEVKLSDETPVEVERVSEYRTVTNNNESQESMNKKKLIDGIVGNAGWTEDDRKSLDAMNEAQLTRIHDSITKNDGEGKGTPAPAPAKPATEPAPTAPTAPTAPAPKVEPTENKKIATLSEYVANAPKEIQEVLNEGVSTYNAQKAEIVAAIIANEKNLFTKEELDSRPLGELKKMAQLMAVPVKEGQSGLAPHYAGQAPTPASNSAVEEPMELPVMNFAKK